MEHGLGIARHTHGTDPREDFSIRCLAARRAAARNDCAAQGRPQVHVFAGGRLECLFRMRSHQQLSLARVWIRRVRLRRDAFHVRLGRRAFVRLQQFGRLECRWLRRRRWQRALGRGLGRLWLQVRTGRAHFNAIGLGEPFAAVLRIIHIRTELGPDSIVLVAGWPVLCRVLVKGHNVHHSLWVSFLLLEGNTRLL